MTSGVKYKCTPQPNVARSHLIVLLVVLSKPANLTYPNTVG